MKAYREVGTAERRSLMRDPAMSIMFAIGVATSMLNVRYL